MTATTATATEIRENGRTFKFVEALGQIGVYVVLPTGDSLLHFWDREEFFEVADAGRNIFDLRMGGESYTLYGSTLRAVANRIRVREAEVGDFLVLTLVTDTRAYEVVGRTAKGLRIRPAAQGEIVKRENVDGNPFPKVWTAVVSAPEAEARLVRFRKDGTLRPFEGSNALRPAPKIDGVPVTVTDYRY